MIDGHAHLFGNRYERGLLREYCIVEPTKDYVRQLSEAKIQKGISVIEPYQLGMYSERAMRELAKWRSIRGAPSHGIFNDNSYQEFQQVQESAYEQVEEIENNLLNNPRLVKLLVSSDLHYLMEHGKESECEDVLRKAKEMGFVGIKLWRTSGLKNCDDQVIKRAVELGLAKVQFHTHSWYCVSEFLIGQYGVSLPTIAEEILQEDGNLYFAHGVKLPLSFEYMKWRGARAPLEKLLDLSRDGIWFGTSEIMLGGTFRKDLLGIIDSFPHLQEKICFETDYPEQDIVYGLRGMDFSPPMRVVPIKDVVKALNVELSGLDSLQIALSNNAQSFLGNTEPSP